MSNMINREQVYRDLWEHTDRQGVITPTQLEMAKILSLPYQTLSVIYSEFQGTGRMRKQGHSFQVQDPDKFEWGAEFQAERKKVRANMMAS